MAKLYLSLRGAIMEREFTQEELSRALGIAPSALSKRMTGKVQWTAGEMYKVLDLLARPDGDITLLFPRDGKSKPTKSSSKEQHRTERAVSWRFYK